MPGVEELQGMARLVKQEQSEANIWTSSPAPLS